jgi:hypothetical protein
LIQHGLFGKCLGKSSAQQGKNNYAQQLTSLPAAENVKTWEWAEKSDGMRATTSAEAGFLQQTAGCTVFAYCHCCACMGHDDVVNCQLVESAPSEYESAHTKPLFCNKLHNSFITSLHKTQN